MNNSSFKSKLPYLGAHLMPTMKISLGTGLILRVLFALNRQGFNHPNEIYRMIEPLSLFFFGDYDPAFEHDLNLMSFATPLFYYPFVKILSWFGLTTAHWLVTHRLIMAVISLFPLYYVGKLLREKTSERFANWSLFFLCLWPPLAYWQIHILGTVLEGALMAMALLLYDHKNSKVSSFLCGVILAHCFFIRIQSALFPLFLSFHAINEKKAQSLPWGVLGALSMAIVIGLVDMKMGQTFWEAPWNYFDYNLIQGLAAKEFGADPFYRYFFEFLKFFGPILFPLVFWGLARGLKETRPLGAYIVFYLVVHTFIQHKEFRFLFAMTPFLLGVAAIGLYQVKNATFQKWLPTLFFIGYLVSFYQIAFRYQFNSYAGNCQRQVEVSKFLSQVKGPKDRLTIEGDLPFLCGTFGLRPAVAKVDFQQKDLSLAPGQLLLSPKNYHYEKMAQFGNWTLYRIPG